MLARRYVHYPAFGWGNPLADFDRLFRQMDRWNRSFSSKTALNWGAARAFPALKITEDKDHYYIRAELPGTRTEDLSVQVDAKGLSISGERKITEGGEGVRYHRREREAGRFSRVITLPSDFDPEQVEAKMANGVLTVTVGKADAAKPRQITVH